MTTTIDNNQRIFMLAGMGWNTEKYICNMRDIVKCAKQFEANQPYTIFHLWNNKLEKLSHKKIIDLLQANQLDATFFNKSKKLHPVK